ncbi:hypothetical protein cypCar_00047206, partial [Cyprinus carpio]
LSSDDIRGIQSLYGPNRDKTPIQTHPEVPTTPKACDPNLILDAATTLRDETMFFKDGFFWRRSPNRTVTQLQIKSFWASAPDNIDAAYEDPVQDKLFLFKGRQVWVFNGINLERGYPKTLSSFGLPSSVRKVSAAVYDKNSGKTLLFVDKVYYRITEYTSQLSKKEVDTTIAKAFQLYSDVIPLDFKQIYSGTADIMILFKAGYHGDFYPFDGPNGVLAHANAPGPEQGGDTHFDDDERWTLHSRDINLLLVAAHEFGHALGLEHSKDPLALMYPTYRYVNTNGYTLPHDDRLGVQALYGVRTSTNKPKPNPGPTPPEPCKRDLVFDAATSIRGELFFFKNGYYWKKGYYSGLSMHEIKSTWPSIDSVDAAYEFSDRDISFLFKGQQYWAVKGSTTLPAYPKLISKFGFPTYVRKIDAAVYVKSTSRTLFFVGTKYWSFNERTAQMDSGFPKTIQHHFPGIGSRVDAAFENYGYLYFSEGSRQTEYNFTSRRVNRLLLNYGWLDCY